MDIKHIGKYTVVEKIGQGAMGEVYKALDPVLNRHVAIKTMAAAFGQDSDLRKRFLREAQSAARLAHPNIVTLYDFGEDQGRIYMAMELLGGNDLKDLIKLRTLSLSAKLDLMEQVCDALAAAHATDVVHRDLKPANIHVQPNGQVKILDFGLARLGASEMTKTGMVMGTPHYMSPEQVRGEKADARSDIFSLGAVFYELLAGRKAFDADSLHAVFFQVLEHEPAPVNEWDAEVPAALVPFLQRALAKDPAQRFPHAGEMREALRTVRRVMAGQLPEEAAASMILAGGAAAAGSDPDLTPRIQGAAALAPARQTGRVRLPGTLPGAAATTPSAPPMALAAPGRPARTTLLVGGGALALAALAVGGYLALRPGGAPAPSPAAPSAGVEVVTRQLVLTKLQLAQTKLEVKDYQGAALEASQVLELDAANADARRIQQQVQATLAELDQAAAQARAAVKSADLEAASQALERVLAIDPQHPVAAELSSQLDSRFRGQADQARTSMKRLQAAADEARAGTQRSYLEAVGLAREAEVLFSRGEFTVATQKFFDARNNFERARRAAVERLQAPPPAVAARPSAPPPAAPGSAASPAPLPDIPAAAAAPAVAAGTGLSDEQAVLGVIADYERAIEQKDLALYRRIWPSLSAGEERKLKAAFQATDGQDVRITVSSVKVEGTRATVRLSRNDTIKGRAIPTMSQTVSLAKQGDVWTIREIGQ